MSENKDKLLSKCKKDMEDAANVKSPTEWWSNVNLQPKSTWLTKWNDKGKDSHPSSKDFGMLRASPINIQSAAFLGRAMYVNTRSYPSTLPRVAVAWYVTDTEQREYIAWWMREYDRYDTSVTFDDITLGPSDNWYTRLKREYHLTELWPDTVEQLSLLGLVKSF